MALHLIIGNIFSFLYALCIAVSVVKKNKKDLVAWQVVDVVFSILSNIALYAYAALATNSVALIRNILVYKGKLSKTITVLLVVLCVVIGIAVNNHGLIGWLPIVASSGYTICLYATKSDQQIRWALVPNLMMWFVHDIYVQAYPAAFINLILSTWTAIQICKNHPTK